MRTTTLTRTIHVTGTQHLYRFPNNFGASVVRHEGSYGGDRGLWELAVIQYSSNTHDNWSITYDTPITNDVIGNLSGAEVDELLSQIEALPAKCQDFDGEQ